MEVKELYRYRRADGGITVSPNKPEGEYTIAYRLIADEGKVLTKNGKDLYEVIDVDTTADWYEIEVSEPTELTETT